MYSQRLNYPKKTKAIRWHDIEDVRLDMIDVPKLKDDYVLVKYLYGGICGTDKHSWHHGTMVNKTNRLNYPAILGHEGSGEIIEIGKNVAYDAIGQPIKKGDMVTYHDILSCGKCRFCRQGNGNVCKHYVPAAMKPGCFVQYYTYPASQIIKIEGVSARNAALLEPAATTLHANRAADVKIGDTVLVIGGGPIGLLTIQLLINQGVTNIILMEVQEMKRRVAKDLGATVVVDPTKEDVMRIVDKITNGYGADVVFEDVGLPELQLLALDAVRPHGIVILMGISENPVTLNFFDKVQLKEITIKGTIAVAGQLNRKHDYLAVSDLIKMNKLQIDPLITHEFPIEKYKEGFNTSDNSASSIKVIFKIT